MEFVQTTFETILGRQVELTLIFDHLRRLVRNSEVLSLSAKWEGLLESRGKLWVVRYAGVMLPSNCEDELKTQPPWHDYVFVKFDDSFKLEDLIEDEGDKLFQSLNFMEIIRHIFWKEVYEAVGRRGVAHLFEKCGLLVEASEGFYIFVGHSEGEMYRKMMSYKGYQNQLMSAKTQAVSSSMGQGNPYQLKTKAEMDAENKVESPEPTTPSWPPVQYSLKRKEPPPPEAMDVSVSAPEAMDISVSAPEAKRQKTTHPVSEPRWIKPKPEELQKIIDHRESLLKEFHVPPSQSSCTQDDYVELNFVLIQKNQDFELKNKLFVLCKKSLIYSEKPELPPEWQGLRLPKDLKKVANGKRKIRVKVFTISETLASQFDIRLQPKQRYRKKKGQMKVPEGSTSAPPTPPPPPVPSISVQQYNPVVTTPRSSEPPFVPSVNLPIISCLYNRSAWSKWPRTHFIIRAALQYSANKDIVAAIRHLAESIINSPASSRIAHLHLEKVIGSAWKSFTDKAIPVNSILENIVKNHSTYTHLHRLVKTCSLHWRTKYLAKEARKKRNLENSHELASPTSSRRVRKPKPLSATQQPPPTQTQVAFLSQNTMCSQVDKRKQVSFSFKSLNNHVPHNCVMMTLKQIFHILKLELLLGSKRNIRGFFKFVRKSLILGGVKSSLHLGQLMASVYPHETPFAHVCGGDETATATFVAKLGMWLFDYVMTILKTSFYVTECGDTKYQVRFFLRESWTSAAQKMKTRLLTEKALQVARGGTMTNSVLRFIPKQSLNLRALIMRKKSAQGLNTIEKKSLRLLLQFIQSKITKSSTHLPSSIQVKWRSFQKEWYKMGKPKLYYLRMDIKDAFPSVNTERLKKILYEAVGGGGNLVQKEFAVFCGGKKRYVSTVVDQRFRECCHLGIYARPCIAVDLNRDKPVETRALLNIAVRIICSSSTVRIGKILYDFRYGLPQGWGPSPILCNIYYGYIDALHFRPHLPTEGRFFIREVDDYLFITPEPSEVLQLSKLARAASSIYGIKMNQEKFGTNIFVRSDLPLSGSECDCESTTFYGWNFCTGCGHVRRDYKNYMGQDFCSTISFEMKNASLTPEEFIQRRATMIMPARLSPVILDPALNCPRRILLTVFEASVILGCRFYALCRVVYPSLAAVKEPARSQALFDSIRKCCMRVARFSMKCSSSVPISNSQPLPTCNENAWGCCGGSPGSEEFCWEDIRNFDIFFCIALLGFRLKLKKHSSFFKDKILPSVNLCIARVSRKLGKVKYEAVKKLVGNKIPVYFE